MHRSGPAGALAAPPPSRLERDGGGPQRAGRVAEREQTVGICAGGGSPARLAGLEKGEHEGAQALGLFRGARLTAGRRLGKRAERGVEDAPERGLAPLLGQEQPQRSVDGRNEPALWVGMRIVVPVSTRRSV